MGYRVAKILVGVFVLGCSQNSPTSSTWNSGNGADLSTQPTTSDSRSGDTSSDDQDTENPDVAKDAFCQSMWTADCTKWPQDPKMPPLAQLSDFGLGDAIITDVSADLLFGMTSYDIAVIGREDTSASSRPFLLVFKSLDPRVYSISRFQSDNTERILGLYRSNEEPAWRAVICDSDKACRLVQSKATSLESGALELVSNVDPIPSMEPRSLAVGSDFPGSQPVLVGRDVVRLEEDGTWATLIEGGEGKAFNSAYEPVTSLDVLAVGDDGRITHYSPDGIEKIKTGTTDDFVTGWSRHHWLDASSYLLEIYAMSAQGTALATDSQGNNFVCSTQIEDPVAIVNEGSGYAVQAVTATGSRFVVYQKGGTMLRCPYLGFDGRITGAKSLYCGILTNVLAWNEKEIFAPREASCGID